MAYIYREGERLKDTYREVEGHTHTHMHSHLKRKREGQIRVKDKI